MKGTRPKPYRIGGHPAPTGPALTNDLCGQNVKVKVKTRAVFDFNILTAFIRLGRARPAGAGCPPYYYYFYYLTFLTLKALRLGRARPAGAGCPPDYYYFYYLTFLSALCPPTPTPITAVQAPFVRRRRAQTRLRGIR